MHHYSITPTKNKAFTFKNWLFEINDPKTGIKFLVEYKNRRFIIFDMTLNIISGVAVYYKDKLIRLIQCLNTMKINTGFWRNNRKTYAYINENHNSKSQSFYKVKLQEYYEQERRKM